MTIINSKHIKADEGYDLIRTEDNVNFGAEAFLGTRVNSQGITIQDTPQDFHEEEHVEDDSANKMGEN